MSFLSLLIELQRKLLINLSFAGDKRPKNRPSFLSKTGKRLMLGTTERAQTCREVTEESFCYLFLHFIKCVFITRFGELQDVLDFVPLHCLCSMWPPRLLTWLRVILQSVMFNRTVLLHMCLHGFLVYSVLLAF